MTYSGTAVNNKGTGLGRIFNVVPLATGKHISMKNCDAITFVCYEDGGAQAIAFKESIAGASEQVLPVFTEFYAGDGVGSVWTKEAQTADDAWAKADTTPFDALVVTIRSDQLSPGFDCVECTIDGAGICLAILHDLHVERAPQNLASPVAA